MDIEANLRDLIAALQANDSVNLEDKAAELEENLRTVSKLVSSRDKPVSGEQPHRQTARNFDRAVAALPYATACREWIEAGDMKLALEEAQCAERAWRGEAEEEGEQAGG